MLNVLQLMAAGVFTGLFPPLFAAELLFALRNAKISNVYRTLFLLPTLVPTMVVVLLWKFIYHFRYGMINEFLSAVGLEALRHDWQGSFDTALPALMFFGFPWIHGTTLLILMAGLLSISNEILDAYRIDGGSTFKRIFLIDIPMISGAIRLVVILTVIGALQGINLQFAMTNGGPGYATAVPAYYMYKMAFVGWKMGYASAIGVFLFVTIFVLSYLNMRFARSDIEFEGR